jgi:hypothetical protein
MMLHHNPYQEFLRKSDKDAQIIYNLAAISTYVKLTLFVEVSDLG